METETKLSIIVLTYKSFDKIQENIESILMQKYDNYEVIISDDGSPNFDREYIESIYRSSKKRDNFTVISRKKNLGTVKNLNSAILLSTGDVIVPLAQDDYFYDENVLNNIAGMFKNPDVNVCLGLRKRLDEDDFIPNKKMVECIQKWNRKWIWLRNACANIFYGAAMYYRRDYLLNNGLFDEAYRLVEDYPFAMKCIENGEKIFILNKPTIFYGIDGGTSKDIKNRSSALIADDIQLLKQLIQYSEMILESKVCRQYLSYKLKTAESRGRHCFSRYSNPIITGIVAFSKLRAAITQENEVECRFNILWKIEELATKNHHIKRDFSSCK